ncbi:MAG: hypothetical protein QME66_05875 [Candidatus Eisenbacteria bacterium]|nr:hypothetical protein [Candidatus Eisenbacteria bacterium]
MPKRIDVLTEQQKESLKSWCDEWIKIGLSTEPADWDRQEKALRACYRYAKLNDGIPIIRVASPIVGAFAAPIAANIISKVKKVDIKDFAVDSDVYSAVDSAVDSKVWWHYWLGGALWVYWPSFTQFFVEKCGLDLGEVGDRATAYAELSRSGGYIWPNKYFAMVCDRPEKISRDARGRLHCEDSMAIRWRDGWGLWMWHGVRVPAKLIMDPDSATREDIINETNSEVSRVWAERLGWEKYFKLADVVKQDAWLDPKAGLHYELYDFRKRAGELQPKLLRMESPKINDGTSPVYIEPVPPGISSAQAARRWQMPKKDGRWPEVAECNRTPELVFEWEA